jgi:hypothetical protein
MLSTLGDQCPSCATVKNSFASFKRGRLSVEDEKRLGRPISVSIPENIDAVHDMILADRRIGFRMTVSITWFASIYTNIQAVPELADQI